MDTLRVSLAGDDDVDLYTQGHCHHLALALHRQFGWRILLAIDHGEAFWEDPHDADNTLPAVLHVWAVDWSGQAWDIRGVRPQESVRAETEECWDPLELGFDECRSEAELRPYIGCWAEPGEEPIDRPLHEASDDDVARAWASAQRSLSHLPGWPVVEKTPRPR
jgi:hypothetical protein